jgi:threonylcarbamoyladenosine tRNA methylthiotransferase MtaB
MKRRVAFKTLGCRLNQFETDSMVTDFHKAGYEIVAFNEKADVYIVNSCTVTNQSDRKSRYFIKQAGRMNGADSLLIVAGCMVSSQEDYFRNNKTIAYAIDNKRKSSIYSIVEAHFSGEIINPQSLQQDVFGFSLVEKSFHTRSAIKIQDGCNNYCAYCIVPFVRGKAVSRPASDILDNARQLLGLGNREIVLTGVNISRYNYNGVHFDDLIEQIIDLPGEFRVRISSIEPEGFTDKLIGLFENPKLCPHLHLCLQSGADKVLTRMHRSYTIGQYLDIVEKIKNRYPDFNFTTDILVGFPGETEREFRDTCEIIRQIGFSHIHTFKYSRRKGTKADMMDEQISEKEKNERSTIIREISDRMKYNYRQKFIGKKQNILVERNNLKEGARGYGEHYVPLIIKEVKLNNNNFYKVRLIHISNDKELTMIAKLF